MNWPNIIYGMWEINKIFVRFVFAWVVKQLRRVCAEQKSQNMKLKYTHWDLHQKVKMVVNL